MKNYYQMKNMTIFFKIKHDETLNNINNINISLSSIENHQQYINNILNYNVNYQNLTREYIDSSNELYNNLEITKNNLIKKLNFNNCLLLNYQRQIDYLTQMSELELNLINDYISNSLNSDFKLKNNFNKTFKNFYEYKNYIIN